MGACNHAQSLLICSSGRFCNVCSKKAEKMTPPPTYFLISQIGAPVIKLSPRLRPRWVLINSVILCVGLCKIVPSLLLLPLMPVVLFLHGAFLCMLYCVFRHAVKIKCLTDFHLLIQNWLIDYCTGVYWRWTITVLGMSKFDVFAYRFHVFCTWNLL